MNIYINDYDSELSAFRACSKGDTLYVPVGKFNVEDLVLPHYVSIQGAHQKKSILNGMLNMPNNQGGRVENVSIESITSDRLRDFKFDQVRFFGDIAVHLEGSSYYNTFDMCRIESRIGFDIYSRANANYIRNGRSNCSESHIRMSEPVNGWHIHSVFEGTRTATGNILLKGKYHELLGCWYERSASNKWSPTTIVMDNTTKDCRIIGGMRGYLFSVTDEGSSNVVEPPMKLPSEYK